LGGVRKRTVFNLYLTLVFLERLEDLADALLDFTKTDELHEWLQGMPDLNKRACPFYFSSMS